MPRFDVLVNDENGVPLANCTHARADVLLKKGHAVEVCAVPFTVRLTRPIGNPSPPSPSSGVCGSQDKKRRRQIARLRDRDGTDCFYCGDGMPEDDTTIEHILAKSDGGTDHPSNLVLTHADCNARASNMPVIRKVQLRERLRQSKSATHPSMGDAAHQTHRDSVGLSELAAGMRNRAA
jgi:hypothetical protein